jgi:hypothetical protein
MDNTEKDTEKPSTLDKVGNGVRAVKLVLVGGFWTVGSIGVAFTTQNWWGLLFALYGIYILSGLFTGGSRFLVY